MAYLWLWTGVCAAVLGAYASALYQSLGAFSGAELEAHVHSPALKARIPWLMEHRDILVLASAVWRRVFGVTLMVSVLVGIGTHTTASPLVLAGGALGVFVWLWFVEVGLAWAISEHVACPVVAASLRMLPILHTVSIPFTAPLRGLSEVVRRLVGAEKRDPLQEELRSVVEESQREGALGQAEKEMIEAIVDFRDATVEEIMTPRIDIEGLEYTDDLDRVREFVVTAGHSRFPVYVENLDHIEGVLYVKDLLQYLGRPAVEFRLKPLLRDVIITPESRRLRDVLRDFKEGNIHMAIVVDEYGGTAGLITIEDIIEEIFGDIRDEHETEEEPKAEMVRLPDGSVDVDARMHVDEINHELRLSLPEDGDYDTIGGWIFATLGRVPREGEKLRHDGVEVVVLNAQKTRVDRVRIRVLNREEHEGAGRGSGAEQHEGETPAR